jgi:hypothetical protein
MAAEAVLDAPGDDPTLEQAAADLPAPEQADAKPKKAAKKDAGKSKAKDKGKGKGKGKAEPAAAGDRPTIEAHPRAVQSIAAVKGWCGLAGFVIGGYLSLPTSTFAGAGLRALVAGVICYVAGWGVAVFVWQRLVVLEIKAREQQVLTEALERIGAPAGQAGARDAP